MPGGVRQVHVPATARRRSTLPRLDYADAFVVSTGRAQDRTPEQWARAVLEDAPVALRGALRSAWTALGFQLGPPGSDRHVLGWELRQGTGDFVLLGARSRIGMPAELLLERRQQTLLFCTFVQKKNPLARAVWAGTEPGHRPAVRHVLEQARARNGLA